MSFKSGGKAIQFLTFFSSFGLAASCPEALRYGSLCIVGNRVKIKITPFVNVSTITPICNSGEL